MVGGAQREGFPVLGDTLMRNLLMVGIFVGCLVLKMSVAAGADAELSGTSGVDPEAIKATDTSLSAQGTESLSQSDADKKRIAQNDAQAAPAGAVVAKSYSSNSSESSLQISPNYGISFLGTPYNNYAVGSSGTFGLNVETPLSHVFAAEFEGGYGKYSIVYGPVSHNFNQFLLGSSLKAYLFKVDTFRPYLGAGLVGLEYDGTVCGLPSAPCGQVEGAGEFYAGADLGIMKGFSIGARGSWIVPFLNRPDYVTVNNSVLPGDEERAAMASNIYRISGNVKISF